MVEEKEVVEEVEEKGVVGEQRWKRRWRRRWWCWI